jgi:hypothetical protein
MMDELQVVRCTGGVLVYAADHGCVWGCWVHVGLHSGERALSWHECQVGGDAHVSTDCPLVT